MTQTGWLHGAIAELAALNDDPAGGGITREVYTPTYARAVELVSGWMRDAGLEVRLDAVGNLFARWPGREPDAPALRRYTEVARLLTGRGDATQPVAGEAGSTGSPGSTGGDDEPDVPT